MTPFPVLCHVDRASTNEILEWPKAGLLFPKVCKWWEGQRYVGIFLSTICTFLSIQGVERCLQTGKGWKAEPETVLTVLYLKNWKPGNTHKPQNIHVTLRLCCWW